MWKIYDYCDINSVNNDLKEEIVERFKFRYITVTHKRNSSCQQKYVYNFGIIVEQAYVSLILDGCDYDLTVDTNNLDYMCCNWFQLICEIKEVEPLKHIPYGWDIFWVCNYI